MVPEHVVKVGSSVVIQFSNGIRLRLEAEGLAGARVAAPQRSGRKEGHSDFLPELLDPVRHVFGEALAVIVAKLARPSGNPISAER